MAQTNGEGGASTALKGLRLLTLDRGTEGYGFHMYTNRSLKGQFIKSVFSCGPADLAGMLQGDHMLAVDGVDCLEMSHHEVVERVRAGTGVGKKLLVIDQETEKEMKERGEEIKVEDALVMIPRSQPIKPPKSDAMSDETDSPGSPGSPGSPDSTDGPSLVLKNMSDALPKSSRRQKVKSRDWKSSVQAYNDL